MSFIDLLEKVRIRGKLNQLDEGKPLEECLPLVFTSVDESGISFQNSGGRSIIFSHRGVPYKLGGIDPHGRLTKLVAKSPRNKISDVKLAHDHRKQISPSVHTFAGKPFGVYTKEGAENARRTFSMVNGEYVASRILPPCEFLEAIPMGEYNGVEAYQILFKLNSLESDLRVDEFSQLLRERLNQCSVEELEARHRDVIKLYGRFCIWAGLNARILHDLNRQPTTSSFAEQNFVISRVGDGYGVLRVDHTSTVRSDMSKEELGKYLRDADRGSGFYMIPTGLLVAIDLSMSGMTRKERRRVTQPFEIGYNFRGPLKSNRINYPYFVGLLERAYDQGFAHRAVEPIREEMFRKVLE